jgi:hypothetical protein
VTASPRLAAALLLALATPAARAGETPPPASPPVAEGATRNPEVVELRFSWPGRQEAQVTYRHTRIRTGAPRTAFSARYRSRAEPDGDGLRIVTTGTTWEGDLPFPPATAREALRASEQVVQRVGPEGQFAGLEGEEAMRPVLAHLFEDAKVPPSLAERAVALAQAAMRAEAEETWNLAVGFWTGADLELGEDYVTRSEGELPFAPGVTAVSAVEFTVRRRVPCTAGERAPRCVEVTLRSTPERAAVDRVSKALLARLAGRGAEVPVGAREDLAVESELLLVTEPGTLRPFRMVWTKSVRAGQGEGGLPALEEVERHEYDYRYPPPRKPPARPKKTKPPSLMAR